MARHLRLSFEGATYHITARGNRKERIFYSDTDKVIFLNKMEETFEKYSFICYTYCLMNNHYQSSLIYSGAYTTLIHPTLIGLEQSIKL